MSTKAATYRQHILCVSVAKHAAMHPKHGIVSIDEAIPTTEHRSYGLNPILLYSISVAGMPIRWTTFSALDRPRPLCGVLKEAWRNASGLRGRPETLKISRHLADAAPSLAGQLAEVGVQTVVAAANDKQASSCLRSAQYDISRLDGLSDIHRITPRDIKSLNTLFAARHDFEIQIAGFRLSGEERLRVHNWLALPSLPAETDLAEKTDWTPGPWLVSWEKNLPPQAKHLRFSNRQGLTTLAPDHDPEPVGELDDAKILAKEDIRHLLACWPNKPAGAAAAIGITLRELQWYLSGRADIGPAQSGLYDLLNLEYDSGGHRYESDGGLVLVATSPSDSRHAYNFLSGGGDLLYSFEALPDKGVPDPSWRYLIFEPHGARFPSIIMIPRGTPVSEQTGDDLFVNFEGQKNVPATLYRDIVSTCSKTCGDPGSGKREMERFALRNRNKIRNPDSC